MKTRRIDEEFTPQSPWLDLVNSQHWDGFGQLTDHLLDAKWMGRFLRYWNVRPDQLRRGSRRAELAELRDLLRQSTETIATGDVLHRAHLDSLNDFLRAPSYLRAVAVGGEIRIETTPVRRNWKWISGQIAASFVQTVQERADRVKVCGNPDCRWAFVDATKGNTRRWCKDRRCGNRDRVRRARERERE